jgi:hypothetical protein
VSSGAHVARAAGETCYECGSPPVAGKRRCAVHLEQRRMQEAKARARRRKKGLCLTCGKPVAVTAEADQLHYCAKHLEYYRTRR